MHCFAIHRTVDLHDVFTGLCIVHLGSLLRLRFGTSGLADSDIMATAAICLIRTAPFYSFLSLAPTMMIERTYVAVSNFYYCLLSLYSMNQRLLRPCVSIPRLHFFR